MCELVNEMPKKQNKNNRKKNREILNIIKIEETLDAKKPYRFRMLFFKNPELNNREEPFVVKYVHEYRGLTDDGKPDYDYVNCPRSRHIHWDNNPYETCPMCVTAGKYFKSFEISGYKDRAIQAECNKFKAKRIVLIPVMVVQDPNHPENNGKFGVFKIRETDYKYVKNDETGKWDTIDHYDILEKAIDSKVANGIFPFNSNGVDLVVSVEKVTVDTVTPSFSYNKINKLGLTSKQYEIPDINKDSVNSLFGKTFDEECYTSVTTEELNDFYDKHIGVGFEIPDDDIEDFVDVKPQPTKKPTQKTNTVKKPTQTKVVDTVPDVVDDVVDELIDDDIIDDIPMDSAIDEIDANDLIDEIVESSNETVVDKTINENSVESLDQNEFDELDDFLNDLNVD